MAVLGYDAARILIDAMKRAGSTDGPKVRDALAQTKGYAGVSGSITIDAERNSTKNIVVLKIDGGKVKFQTSIAP